MKIGPVEVGGSNPCRFIVECSNAHNSSFDRAMRLVDAAARTGAEFVKFQAYTPDELVALRGDGPAPEPWGAQGWTMRRLYEKAQTPLEWLPQLFERARSHGLVPFSSVFGLTSLAALEAVGCPAYKIARLDNSRDRLLRAAKATSKPVLVSADAGTMQDRLLEYGVLYCPAGYPPTVDELRLPRFGEIFLGLSSHYLDPDLPIAAVARGAKIIEMHMELEYEPSELEHNVSLTPPQFTSMIQRVRNVERMLA